MDLMDFVKLEKMESYDFKEEIVDFRAEDDAIDRVMIYQALYLKGKKNTVSKDEVEKIAAPYSLRNKQEPDNCDLAKEIYGLLWDESLLKICTSGDTMNSWKTTWKEMFAPHKSRLQQCGRLSGLKKVRSWSIRASMLAYSAEKEEFQQIINACPGAENFLNACYTLGNFLPIPPQFQSRGTSSLKDYWDLTLVCIYNYYMQKGHPVDMEEFHHPIIGKPYTLEWMVGAKNLAQCEEWLSFFPSWKDFVKKNFLESFVEDSYGPPKPLWKEHFTGPVLPKEGQLQDFFTNAANWIEKRGKAMANALREKTIP